MGKERESEFPNLFAQKPPNLFQESGVNTLDPVFGWNIAMHCAALGKQEHLQAVIDIHITLKDYYAVGDEDSDDEFGDHDHMPDGKRDSDDKASSAWQQPFPLDLGHKSYRTLNLRQLYAHAIQGADDEDLRQCFQGDQKTGYWGRQRQNRRKEVRWYPTAAYLRGSTPETIAAITRNKFTKAIKLDISQAMKAAEGGRRKVKIFNPDFGPLLHPRVLWNYSEKPH